MDWKKFWKAIIFPHLAVIILFLPFSISLLVFSLIYLKPTAIVSIISYLLAFYMLIVLCFRIPKMISFFKTLKKENKFIQKWFSDVHLRMNVSLYGSLVWNGAFAILQLGLGFYHGSLWFYSMSAYYMLLAIMRFFLLKHTRAYKVNKEEFIETKKYTLCGWLLLVMNLALAIIIFFIVYWNKTFIYSDIITITLATYTFMTFTFAIINCVKYRKYNSPIYSAAKIITLISACVSMLTLETTMLTTFGTQNSEMFRQIMLACTGTVVTIFTIAMAIIMIIRGTKKLRSLKQNLSIETCK